MSEEKKFFKNNHFSHIKRGTLLVKLHIKKFLSKSEVLDFLEYDPPVLNHYDSEAILKELINEKLIIEENNNYKITKKGERGTSTFLKIGKIGYNLLLNPIKAPLIASKIGIISNIFLGIIIILIGFISGSLGLLSKGFDSALDVLVSCGIWLGLRLKKENISAVLISIVMIISGIFLIFESTIIIFQPQIIEYAIPAIIIALITILINAIMMFYKHFVGKRFNIFSLVADSYHNRLDIISSTGVLIGIISSILGFLLLDPIIGIIISILIIFGGISLMKESIFSITGKEINWYKYSMNYEKKLAEGIEEITKVMIHDSLVKKGLTIKELINKIQKNDPFLTFVGMDRNIELSIFTYEKIKKILLNMEKDKLVYKTGNSYNIKK